MGRIEVDLALRGHDEGASTMIGSVGQRLRALRKEERASGEGLVGRALSGSPEGLLKIAGLGAGAGIAFGAYEGVKKALEGTAELVKKSHEWGIALAKGGDAAAKAKDEIFGMLPFYTQVRAIQNAIFAAISGTAEMEERHNRAIAKKREEYKTTEAEIKAIHASINELNTTSGKTILEYTLGNGADMKRRQADLTFKAQNKELDTDYQRTSQIADPKLREKERANIARAREQAEQAHGDALRMIDQDGAIKTKKAQESLNDSQSELAEQKFRNDGRIMDAEMERISRQTAQKKRELYQQEYDDVEAGANYVERARVTNKQVDTLEQTAEAERVKIRQDAARQVVENQSQLNSKMLTLQGKHVEAQNESIRAGYVKRIQDARDDAERESLIHQEAADLAGAEGEDLARRRKARYEGGSRGGISSTQYGNGFTGVAERFKASENERLRREENAKRLVDIATLQAHTQQETNKLLQQILAKPMQGRAL